MYNLSLYKPLVPFPPVSFLFIALISSRISFFISTSCWLIFAQFGSGTKSVLKIHQSWPKLFNNILYKPFSSVVFLFIVMISSRISFLSSTSCWLIFEQFGPCTRNELKKKKGFSGRVNQNDSIYIMNYLTALYQPFVAFLPGSFLFIALISSSISASCCSSFLLFGPA